MEQNNDNSICDGDSKKSICYGSGSVLGDNSALPSKTFASPDKGGFSDTTSGDRALTAKTVIKSDGASRAAQSNDSPSATEEEIKSDKKKRKRAKRDDDDDDEEWREIKRLVTSDNDKKTLNSIYLASNENRAFRHPYWLLVSPVFIEGEKQVPEDEKRLGNLINLDDKVKKGKECYMFVSLNKRTRVEVLKHLRVASVTYATPVAYCKFKKLCGGRPSYVVLMNRRSRMTDRLMCIKQLSKKFPSLLIAQGQDGSFTEIQFSCRGQVSATDVDKAVKEYAKYLKEQKREMTDDEIKNKVEELEVYVAASSFNRAGPSKITKINKGNFNRKFQAFVLDTDKQLEQIKKFCQENKNIVAAVIVYENRACLIRFDVPTEIKTLASAIREKTGIVLEQKDVYKMKYTEAIRFLQNHYLVEKVYAHGSILEKANNAPAGALSSKIFILRKKDDSKEGFTQKQLLYLINNPKVKKMHLSDTNRKGAVWCSKVLPPDDIYFGGNKEILHDIEFESVTDTQFYSFLHLENTTFVKKTIIYKDSIEPFLRYPFRNKTNQYRYFLSNPNVIDEETAKGYVEKGIMSACIRTKVPSCKSIILKKREPIKLEDIPHGLIPIDMSSARRCSDKKTFPYLNVA